MFCKNKIPASETAKSDIMERARAYLKTNIAEQLRKGYFKTSEIANSTCDNINGKTNNQDGSWFMQTGLLGMPNWAVYGGGALLTGTIIYFTFIKK